MHSSSSSLRLPAFAAPPLLQRSRGHRHNFACGAVGLHAALLPIAPHKIDSLVPSSPSSRQWQAFWGNSRSEKVRKVVNANCLVTSLDEYSYSKSAEGCIIVYGGVLAAWFLSFLVGKLLGLVFGVVRKVLPLAHERE
jgi:hypothetical protein